jgi:hypothetical protein
VQRNAQKTLKYNNINVLILFLLVVGLCFSCKTNKTDLDDFLYKIDNTLLASERSKLIQCSDVECMDNFILSNPNGEFKYLYSKIPKNLIDTLDSNGVKNNRILFLLICYNYQKSNKPISFKEILEKIKNYYKNQEQILEQNTLEKINRLTIIAETNFKRINIGDTICLSFSN